MLSLVTMWSTLLPNGAEVKEKFGHLGVIIDSELMRLAYYDLKNGVQTNIREHTKRKIQFWNGSWREYPPANCRKKQNSENESIGRWIKTAKL